MIGSSRSSQTPLSTIPTQVTLPLYPSDIFSCRILCPRASRVSLQRLPLPSDGAGLGGQRATRLSSRVSLGGFLQSPPHLSLDDGCSSFSGRAPGAGGCQRLGYYPLTLSPPTSFPLTCSQASTACCSSETNLLSLASGPPFPPPPRLCCLPSLSFRFLHRRDSPGGFMSALEGVTEPSPLP
jgi:hypothetical protein